MYHTFNFTNKVGKKPTLNLTYQFLILDFQSANFAREHSIIFAFLSIVVDT